VGGKGGEEWGGLLGSGFSEKGGFGEWKGVKAWPGFHKNLEAKESETREKGK